MADIIQERLWLYALQLTADLHSSTPGSGLFPAEIFSGIKNNNHPLNFHPFGCPIFTLDPTLLKGHKLPHWQPRLVFILAFHPTMRLQYLQFLVL
jgi:hypothetical protein